MSQDISFIQRLFLLNEYIDKSSPQHLRNPEPDLLKPIPWDLLRPDLCIQRCLATPNVCLVGFDKFTALKDLPEEVQLER